MGVESMFCSFYFGGSSEFSEFKQTIIRLLQGGEIVDTDDNLTVSCDGFTLSIKEGGHGVRFASEDHGIELKFNVYIDVIVSYTNWAQELMAFIGELLCSMDGDCILELNDKPILLRKDHVVTVDEKKLSGEKGFPFGALGIDYQIGDIA
jgi:hypothetical protein